MDEERFEEAKVELTRTVRSNDNLGIPLLLLANKQDLPGAKEPHDIETLLQLRESLHNTLYHVQPACAITGTEQLTTIQNKYYIYLSILVSMDYGQAYSMFPPLAQAKI